MEPACRTDPLRALKSRRLRFWPLLFAVCLEIYGVVQWCRNRTAKENSYSIEILNTPLIVHAGVPIILQASFTNEQGYQLAVKRSQDFHDGLLSVKVSNAAGPVPEKLGPPIEVGGYNETTIEPGEKMTQDIHVSKYYDLAPGEYTVAITTNYDVTAWDQHKLLAPFNGTDATAHITVLP